MQSTKEILSIFHEIFNEKCCQELAINNKFIQRSSSRLKGDEIIKILTIPSEGISEDSLDGLCERIQKMNPDADISASALAQRINTQAAVDMMKGCFAKLLQLSRQKILKCPDLARALKGFGNIYIQDSTVCLLNEKLSKIYKGTRKESKSQVKIDLIHDFSSGTLVDTMVCTGNLPDQGLSGRILKFIRTGDLVIRLPGVAYPFGVSQPLATHLKPLRGFPIFSLEKMLKIGST